MNPGSVPTSRVGPILDVLVNERWPYGGGIDILADKVGCDWGAIDGILRQQNEGTEFDLADKLFCALGRADVWQGELADVYDGVVFVQRCSLHSCSKTFPEVFFGRRKLYCSVNCKVLASKVASGDRPGNRFVEKGYCRSGRHKMTPDNTMVKGHGYNACRECDRQKKVARNARYNAKRRAAVTA